MEDEAGRQSGGTRGSSNQGGPERSGEPRKDSAAKINSSEDRGSRSSEGRDPLVEAALTDAGESELRDQPGRLTDAPRGPLPEGAERADYVGGEEPHQTREPGGSTGASGKRNDVL
jgi:hypothetical protein